MEAFKRLSDKISVHNRNSSIFLVNGEWTFILPDGLYYELDSEFDGGISGGIDLSGSVKPMVIKGLYDGSKHLFNFALQEHYNFFGNGNTIIDCKYDNRFVDADPSSEAQIIITDEDDLYVDITSENIWPFGIQVQLRARSPKMTPFDFDAVINCGRSDYDLVMDKLKELAYSIRLSELESESENVHRTVKTANNAQSVNNCIIENGVLVKYIGRETDIVLPDGIEKLADGLFSGRKIRSIVIPEGVHTIGRRAFENCLELEKVSLPSTLEELGGYAFVDCHKLKSINLGDELTSIEDSVFSECFELRNVIIPRNVERIEAFAFKSCRKFTSIVIPDGVESISLQAFANCKNLSYLYIPASVEEFSEDFLGNTPFVGCDMLTVYCPSGSAAEEYCHAHGISCCAAEEPEFQESEYGFSGDEYESALDNHGGATFSFGSSSSPFSFEIGINIDEMEQDNTREWMDMYGEYVDTYPLIEFEGKKFVFSGLGAHASVDAHPIVRKVIANGGLHRKTVSGQTDYLVVNPGNAGQSKIDAAIEQIEKGNYIKVILLEDLEKALGETSSDSDGWAFSCSGTEAADNGAEEDANNFEIDEFGTLTYYGGEAERLILPKGISTIGEDVFLYNSNIKSAVVPEGVKTLGESAFWGCENLQSITLPSTIREIGEGAFCETGITSIVIPEGCKTIGEDCFAECKNLQSVTLPSTIREIGSYAFKETALTKIVIPEGCEKIGDLCFEDCKNLKDIFVPASVNEIGLEALGCRSISTIHTVKGSVADKYAEEEYLRCDYLNEEEVEEKAAKEKELEEFMASYNSGKSAKKPAAKRKSTTGKETKK